jgi:hypothetical protein
LNLLFAERPSLRSSQLPPLRTRRAIICNLHTITSRIYIAHEQYWNEGDLRAFQYRPGIAKLLLEKLYEAKEAKHHGGNEEMSYRSSPLISPQNHTEMFHNENISDLFWEMLRQTRTETRIMRSPNRGTIPSMRTKTLPPIPKKPPVRTVLRLPIQRPDWRDLTIRGTRRKTAPSEISARLLGQINRTSQTQRLPISLAQWRGKTEPAFALDSGNAISRTV